MTIEPSNISKRAIGRRLSKGSSKWIQGAIKHPGSFSAAAHKHGQSTQQYANSVLRKSSNPTLLRRARLAKTLAKMRAKR